MAFAAGAIGNATQSSSAADTVRYEAPCQNSDIFAGPAPLRQTIILLDEAMIAHGESAATSNPRLTRTILQAVDALQSQPTGNAVLRERVSVYVAKADGSQIAPIFLGCAASWTQAQIADLTANDSTLTTFVTGGTSKRIENARGEYEAALASAVAAAIREAQPTDALPDAVLRSLQSSPRLMDASGGIPRLILVTPFAVSREVNWVNDQEARAAGFAAGARSGLDLRRAEVYVVGADSSSNSRLQAFAEAFLLPIRGTLAGWRSDGLPSLSNAPTEVQVFGGTVQLGDISAPVQIRIATDADGNLVNSWIEVTTGQSKATPITGKAICTESARCEIRGDGRMLGQAWNPDQDGKPEFSPAFAWSGLRFFEMSINGENADIKIWDPQARIDLGKGEQDDIRISVVRTPQQTF